MPNPSRAEKKEREKQFQQLYTSLNSGQKQAVDAIEGPVMVLAGPGTGKTQTLTMRIANILLQTQMDPWNILCLTFTESAVSAMQERLFSIIGTDAYSIKIHTFHSFCNDIIQDNAEYFAKSRQWQPLSDIERIELVQAILDNLPGTSPLKPFGNPYLFLRDISDAISKLKQEDISPVEFGRITKNIGSFVKKAQPKVDVFHRLKPKERTDGACEDIFEMIQVEAKKADLPVALQDIVQSFHEKYKQHVSEADDERSASKVRTAFKNDIKRWVDRLARDLIRHQDIAQLYKEYQKELHVRGRYDYEDMIGEVLRVWREHPELLSDAQEQYQYVLVDEYQDTNGAQNEIVRMLGSFDDSPNIFVVGDDKQSIYRFQGASMNNMLLFYDAYKAHVQLVSLQENYRSQTTVLEAASHVIQHNTERLSRYLPEIHEELIPKAGRTTMPLQKHQFLSVEAEDYFVAKRIQKMIGDGVDPADIAVLYRYHRDGQNLLRLLRALQVPVRLEAGENVLDDPAIIQYIQLLTYIAYPEREELLAHILQFEWWGIPPLDVLKVMNYAGTTRQSLLAVIVDNSELEKTHVSQGERLQSIVDKFASWHTRQSGLPLCDVLFVVLQESGWLDLLVQDNTNVATMKKLSTLLQVGKEMCTTNPATTLQDFIRSIQVLQEYGISLNLEPWHVNDHAVRLMTAHKAKGLEFEHVFIMRLNDKHWGNNPEPAKIRLPHGLVPYDRIITEQNNEDERRLFYVALTRAKQSLVLSRASHTESGRVTTPSIFWQEIPSEIGNEEVHEMEDGEFVDNLSTNSRFIPHVDDGEVKAWLQELLKKYRVSVTHLNNYIECPKLFYVKNFIQVPSERTPHQAFGTAVHEALQAFFEEFRNTQKIPDRETLISKFEWWLDRQILSPTEKKDAALLGSQYLSSYYDHYQSSFTPFVRNEFDFASHRIHLSDLTLTGKIDKIELIDASDVLSDGSWKKGASVKVIDYKTGNPDKGVAKLKKGQPYWRQLVFYKLLTDLSPQFPYTMTVGELDFIQPSEKQGFVRKSVEITDDDVAELRDTIHSVWKEIRALSFLEDGVGCGECEVCTRYAFEKRV